MALGRDPVPERVLAPKQSWDSPANGWIPSNTMYDYRARRGYSAGLLAQGGQALGNTVTNTVNGTAHCPRSLSHSSITHIAIRRGIVPLRTIARG